MRLWLRRIERIAEVTLAGISIYHAYHLNWAAAQYFIMAAAALELEEWVNG